jgi:ubiquinone/menaquinone biosynthesis C-methylase UbiE
MLMLPGPAALERPNITRCEMRRTEKWYFDQDPSELYERLLVPAKFLPWAEDLVRIGNPQPGNKVLDVACGTGTVTRLIPPYVGVSGTTTGLDFNADRLEVAAALPLTSGFVIEWKVGDACDLPFRDAEFDLVFCQQGLQFFPDKLQALKEMHRVLVTGGRLILGVWCSFEHQPGGRAMADALERHVSPEAGDIRREPFCFGDADVIEHLVAEAGFHNIMVNPTVKNVHFPSAEAFTKRYISARVPLNMLVAAANEKAREAVVADVNAALKRYETDNGLELPTAVNVVTAHA